MAEPTPQEQEQANEERTALLLMLGQKDLMICHLQAKVKILTGRLHASDGPARTQ